MTRRSILTACLTLAIVPTIAAAQQFTRPDKIAGVPKPVAMDTTGRFRAAVSRVGDDMFIAGQPTELGLREMHDRGVTTVVNLRTPEEMKAIGFDEAAVVAQLGMKYVYLPVRGTADFPYAPETLAKFTDAVSHTDGKVLLHCTIAWRASHLWAAYLIAERGIPLEQAVDNAEAINFMGHMSSGPLPIEGFLGRDLPSLHHGGN